MRSTRWYVEPYDKNDPKSVQIAEYIEENLFSGPPKGLSTHWDDFIRLTCLMFPFGHSVFEKVYEVDNKGYAKWKKFAERPQETIKDFTYDEKGGPIFIEQYAAGTSFVQIPVENSLIFTHRKEGGRLHGISALRAPYKHWFIKDFLLKISNIGIEKNYVGTPVARLPENIVEGDKEEAEKIVSNLRSGQDAGVVLPYGFTLDMFEGKRTAVEVLPYIQYQDEMIAKAFLAHFLQLGTGSVGSFALGKDQSDFFLMSLNAQGNYICNTINSYAIPQLVDYNWDVEGYPKLRCDKVGGRDTTGLITGVSSLVAQQIILPDQGLEEFMRDVLALPEVDEDTIRGGPAEAFAQTVDADGNSINPQPNKPAAKKPVTPEDGPPKLDHKVVPVDEDESIKATECGCGGKQLSDNAGIKWRRDLTVYEKRIKFADIKDEFDTSEAEFVKQGTSILGEQFAPFLKQLAILIQEGKWEEISNLTINNGPLLTYVESYLTGLFNFGVGQTADELDTEAPDTVPDVNKQLIAVRSATVAEKTIVLLRSKVIFDTLNSVESGTKPKDAVKQAEQGLKDVMKKELDGHATVQTAWAINSGRHFVAGDSGVKVAQYSAILDDRTCALCRELDGQIFDVTSKEFKKFTPPVHNRCRCIFAYIMPDEANPPDPNFKPPSDDIVQRHGSFVPK